MTVRQVAEEHQVSARNSSNPRYAQRSWEKAKGNDMPWRPDYPVGIHDVHHLAPPPPRHVGEEPQLAPRARRVGPQRKKPLLPQEAAGQAHERCVHKAVRGHFLRNGSPISAVAVESAVQKVVDEVLEPASVPSPKGSEDRVPSEVNLCVPLHEPLREDVTEAALDVAYRERSGPRQPHAQLSIGPSGSLQVRQPAAQVRLRRSHASACRSTHTHGTPTERATPCLKGELA
mmetsp:Transcript_90141/g.263575  ORF Transcript_90141/g.263575 Transcript_90141/m.263575 type:complete len:231 (+) Transcript_90141:79-771(+)